MTKFVEQLLGAVAFVGPALVLAVIVAAILVWGVKRSCRKSYVVSGFSRTCSFQLLHLVRECFPSVDLAGSFFRCLQPFRTVVMSQHRQTADLPFGGLATYLPRGRNHHSALDPLINGRRSCFRRGGVCSRTSQAQSPGSRRGQRRMDRAAPPRTAPVLKPQSFSAECWLFGRSLVSLR